MVWLLQANRASSSATSRGCTPSRSSFAWCPYIYCLQLQTVVDWWKKPKLFSTVLQSVDAKSVSLCYSFPVSDDIPKRSACISSNVTSNKTIAVTASGTSEALPFAPAGSCGQDPEHSSGLEALQHHQRYCCWLISHYPPHQTLDCRPFLHCI